MPVKNGTERKLWRLARLMHRKDERFKDPTRSKRRGTTDGHEGLGPRGETELGSHGQHRVETLHERWRVMARKDALLQLHKSLLNRRGELFKRLGVDLQDLDHTGTSSGAGDAADAAFDSGSEEIASQLAEFEARELRQIQRALTRLKAGSYGQCEVCHAKIPVARLNALPYSTMCIRCQREVENDSGWLDAQRMASWDKISDVEPRLEDRKELDLADIEMDMTK